MVLIAGGDLLSFSQLALLVIIEADPQIACMYLPHADCSSCLKPISVFSYDSLLLFGYLIGSGGKWVGLN